jgi:hypothetical protein
MPADRPQKRKKLGLTSVDAAALLLSEGRTKDPNEAAQIAEGKELNLDGLHRAGLRRSMGFDFELQIMPNVILVTAKERPFARTRAKIYEGETDKYGNIIAQELINRLVDACVRLKDKRDELIERQQNG